MTSAKLTAKVKAGGCASKLSPKILERVLGGMPRHTNENVLVGFDTSDDAGVYRLTDDLAIVQTVDFFTPVVDDPYTFGAIAAANAASDVYAMGGRPVSALSILAWPADEDEEILRKILAGGAEKLKEADCVILGGHSVNDPEIKFGYAVTGVISPSKFKPNAGARPGDVLVLTKKIGTGVIATALKRGFAEDNHVEGAINSMTTLNRAAAEAMADLDVHGLTDVTGFGLLGHAREMAMGSGVTLEIETAGVQFLDGAVEYAKKGALPGGLANNRDFVSSCVGGLEGVDDLLYDPQTSGGLLASLPEKDAATLLKRLPDAYRVGRVTERADKPLMVA
ncbi:MAG: selenide, water dikinase SelD [Alphaproteobacteria bacterium]|nr:selenide, water dikinase SelD [Alphaproteobacteria bacterium]